ncbi:16S rRNA (guanine(966)-N(2))-methyltransferase RsmD [candidate division WOR-1 bacterium RIFOXYA12_FULL_43_27]|uniref:16S rRNA (Guanine(966)-N(2))-methyltransferase RsmD n=1 Tax=candidate division WOR-1 bacterium RIFOXYC2_FULL_46_14 TaxID=1802587 RepID=A0A1F4U3T5_UNCSA|nr:MAG: 16S rRNA (guanine(966)-N(2))-methyltransferase RsmD [candidate division WOR-1 bacterium RIFOXYA12_FULL_43_27]OGC20134.1 MAG: 16S rRNA (guanine(966)-N(2))-methyltransferase RsmD [candidate division WOR-1 bacterium RIFOXYB2_FULL_46_45]OGC32129.1 MAG: 16S rRNA (guanine(966)-N(2))-methyltransferase RsmD [candidate division WOR-1 bacterium RIFOXYA2_FULL_46_56]OGC39529.1 MAG: 16S rRNA (guanine(966)-N(2))-methyltransferase RsmD [candidate division WOR-1 bacterium RIFOXYC2_FULL_46_14]
MRVISGTAKGRKIKAPKTNIRPLSDQAKEGLFNILGERVPDSAFLDLFAGSGNVGIEALSRGAKLAIFVELDKRHVKVIHENLKELSFDDRAEVYLIDALRAIKILASKGARFDIIFLGAPYNSPALDKALLILDGAEILKENGIIVAEYRFKQRIGEKLSKLKKIREQKYGDTMLSFYQ